jgi:predicted metal-dependent peptidase
MLEERKVQKAKISLMRNPKFALLSGVLMVGRTSVVDNLPTACTNGRDEKYGRKFVADLRDQELGFLIAHEASHKMYRHLTTWKKLHDEDHRLANQACDYVINLMLRDLDPNESFIAMPRYPKGHKMAGQVMGLIDERFRGMNTKQVFDILKQEKEEGGGGDAAAGRQPVLARHHDIENDEVRTVAAQVLIHLGALGGCEHIEARASEVLLE